ncbi:MAG: cyclodeaminase/cyclohydrolase family protein [Phycisphaerales bacterium]|nr:cyclodeaminase/cyclohydrolase family protein [Phycisphaerales bacterium]
MTRMEQRLGDLKVSAALEAIASRTPSPGGGAAVALAAAVAAALGEMVANYAAARKSSAEHRGLIEAHGRALGEARNSLLELVDDDARAYQALSDAMAQQKRGEADAHAVGLAAQLAAATPMATIEACEQVIAALEGLGPHAGWLVSDLVASAALIGSAARGAVGHVQANAPLMNKAALDGQAIVARARAAANDVAGRADALVAAMQ